MLLAVCFRLIKGFAQVIIIQDKQDIPIEDMKSIIKFLANQNKDKQGKRKGDCPPYVLFDNAA